MIRFGASLNSVAGWLVNPTRPREEQARHLAAIRTLVTEHRLRVIEVAADYSALYPQVMNRSYYEEVATLQRELGFAVTLHLPFLWLDASSLVEEMRAASVCATRATVEAMSPLNVETYVLHLWGAWTTLVRMALRGPEREPLEHLLLRQAQRSLTEALEFLPREKTCIENLEGVPFSTLLPLADTLGVRLCLDTGHAIESGEDPVTLVRAHLPRLGEIHLHDARRDGNTVRVHIPVGDGTLNISAFLQSLADADYAGPVVLEMNRAADLMTSLERLATWR